MKVICAPDSFKESLSAERAAGGMAQAGRRASPTAEVEVCPISDGGEGFASVIARSNPHTKITSTCTGSLGSPVEACWYTLGTGESSAAVIEMAQVSGLQRVPVDQRDPTRTSTLGTGELIRLALK
ncbi:MAG: glycerate kinase, partial [Desulfobulbaceae bacterium]|nr:glycerate kinase [Desulfobulbaceae bacterium]